MAHDEPFDEEERLIAASVGQSSALFPVGSSWTIDNRGKVKAARLFTGKLAYVCCFSTGVEIVYIPDATVVQVRVPVG